MSNFSGYDPNERLRLIKAEYWLKPLGYSLDTTTANIEPQDDMIMEEYSSFFQRTRRVVENFYKNI